MFSRNVCFSIVITALLLLSSGLATDSPSWKPDVTLKGSSLTGWHVLGQADWKLQNGELVGTAKGGSGGWLVLDKSLQDVGFYAMVKCTAGCKSGVLFRAEKTPQGGMKGVYVSLTEGDMASYKVTLDAQGQEIQREKLVTPPRGGGAGGAAAARGAAPAGPAPAAAPAAAQAAPGALTGGSGGSFFGGSGQFPKMPAGVDLPGLNERPTVYYNKGDWNAIDLIVVWNTVVTKLNGGSLGGAGGAGIEGGTASYEAGKYGPIALYAGGTGEVRMKDVSYKDLMGRVFPHTATPNWREIQVSDWHYAYSQAACDVNHDGNMDVVGGPYWYAGPDYSVAKEVYQVEVYNPTVGYSIPAMSQFCYDWTGDGWPDVLNIAGNAGNGKGTLFVNPKGESRRWDPYPVIPMVGNETQVLGDIDGDGRPEFLGGYKGVYLAYFKYDPADATKVWDVKIVSEEGPWGINIGHGIGMGDINGDGRKDFLNTYGWWEQPPAGSSQKTWTYHPQAFGRWGRSAGGPGGAEIGAYDVNGDGLNDVVTAMEGHGYGLGWYEQKRDSSGKISFVEHIFMGGYLDKNAGDVTFTEPHATAFADFDGDGILDLVTGKSSEHHHGYGADPDPYGPPYVYVYRTVRNKNAPGGAEFVPELANTHAGVGDFFWVGDMNKDSMPDIVISATQGTFVLLNQHKKPAKTTPVAQGR